MSPGSDPFHRGRWIHFCTLILLTSQAGSKLVPRAQTLLSLLLSAESPDFELCKGSKQEDDCTWGLEKHSKCLLHTPKASGESRTLIKPVLGLRPDEDFQHFRNLNKRQIFQGSLCDMLNASRRRRRGEAGLEQLTQRSPVVLNPGG